MDVTETDSPEGNFKELRRRHLPLFDDVVHRHDRGWPHRSADKDSQPRPTKRWQTSGIFHFPHPPDEDC